VPQLGGLAHLEPLSLGGGGQEIERERENDALSSSSRLAQVCAHAGRFPVRKQKLQGLLRPRFGTCTSLCHIVLVKESKTVNPHSRERNKFHLSKGRAVKNLWPFLQSTPICSLH